MQLVKISDLARMSGVPTATIKYYMRERLLPGPAKRTSRNMAYYDARLAQRIRAIKDLQQTRFLPLKVIGRLLEPPPSSAIRADLDELQRRQLELPDSQASQDAGHRGGSRAGHRGASPQARLTREQVLATMRLSAEDLDALAELGMAHPTPGQALPRTRTNHGQDAYEGRDLEVLRAIHEIREQGMADVFPKDAWPAYMEATRTLVHTELDMFRRRVLGGAQLPDLGLEQIARLATQLSERLVVAMRDKIMTRELGALSGGQAESRDAPRSSEPPDPDKV